MILTTFFKKKWSYLVLIIGIVLFTIGIFTNGFTFSQITGRSIVLYQFIQLASIIILFVFGYVFLKIIQDKLSDIWIILLSFPAGLCLYVFCANIFLLCDFTLKLERVIISLVLLLIILLTVRKKALKKVLIKPSLPIQNTICIVLGLVLAASSGLIYIIVNYDSFFYFSDYGLTLSKYMCYKDFVSDNSYVLTNIGQFLPIVGSYSGFLGLNTIFHIHSLMFVNTCIIFGVAIYEHLITRSSRKKSIIVTLLATLAFTTCSPFFLFGNWLLSNSWIMFFLLIFFILGSKHIFCQPKLYVDVCLILCGLTLAITMLRKDGLIIVIFMYICLSFSQSKMRKDYPSFRYRYKHSLILALLYLPSGLYLCSYMYILRNILHASTTLAYNDSLLAPRMIILPLLACGTLLYLLLLFIPAEKIFRKHLPLLSTMALLILIGLYSLKDVEHFIDYIDVWSRNFSGIAFGFAGIQLLTLIIVIFGTVKSYDIDLFFIVGYILLIFALYWNKGNLETDIDNSGLRAICQIIPCIYYLGIKKITNIPLSMSVNCSHSE